MSVCLRWAIENRSHEPAASDNHRGTGVGAAENRGGRRLLEWSALDGRDPERPRVDRDELSNMSVFATAIEARETLVAFFERSPCFTGVGWTERFCFRVEAIDDFD